MSPPTSSGTASHRAPLDPQRSTPLRTRATRRSGARLLLAIAWCALAWPAPAQSDDGVYPSWQQLSDVGVIEVVTHDEDGDVRETKVWFVLVDGEVYLRTNGSRWLENLQRNPNLGLRIEGQDYGARALEVSDSDTLERVDQASAEKYGWQERLIHVFRMNTPTILRLAPRE